MKNETVAQVFFFEFCEISKNIFFYRTRPVAASVKTEHQYLIVLKYVYHTYLKLICTNRVID